MEKSHVGMYQCYFCMEDIGILLDRRLRKTLPRQAGVIDMNPCDKCKGYMEQGVIFMSILDSTTDEEMKGTMPNPHRTGGWCVISEDGVKRLLNGNKAMLDFALVNRFMFITDSAWQLMGLPKGETDEG